MASISPTWLYQDRGFRRMVSVDFFIKNKFSFQHLQVKVGLSYFPKRSPLLPYIKCENRDKNEGSFEHVSVERPPYHSYMDSTSGQLEPASGARASIPGEEYWPEGTASRVRAANAPEPTGGSAGSPSLGKNPGSRRKKYKASVTASETSEMSTIFDDAVEAEPLIDGSEDSKDLASDFVVYQTETEEEELTGYALDKKLGLPHPFIDPEVKKPIQEPLTSEELWWNWRKPDKEQWSRWQRRRPDVETVSAEKKNIWWIEVD